MKILLLILFINNTVMATTSGGLDLSFRGGQGWIKNYRSGEDVHSSAIVVDSQSRIIVAATRENSNGVYEVEVKRWLPNGDPDNSFILVSSTTISPINEIVGLTLDDDDGIFYAFTFENCSVPNQSCHNDIKIRHNDKNGMLLGGHELSFDLGGVPLRNNDTFVDIKYIPFQNTLIVVAEADNYNFQDTDFAVANYFVDPFTGELSLQTSFSGDGKQICYFDHFDSSGSYDSPAAVEIIYPDSSSTIPSSMVIGGSAFEGDGVNSDGWNLAFCEFNIQSGGLINQWSTQTISGTIYSVEKMQDMVFDFRSNLKSIIVAAENPGISDLDFSITKFTKNESTDIWSQSTDFGGNNTGWNSVGYSELFIGNTDDHARKILVEPDGTILVAGNSTWVDGFINHSKAALAKFHSSGVLDTTWAYLGKITHTFKIANQSTITDQVYSMAFDSTADNIYLAGAHINNEGDMGGFTANLINIDLIFKDNFDQ